MPHRADVQRPKAWPADAVGYLTAPMYSPKLTALQMQSLKPAFSAAPVEAQQLVEPCATPCPDVRIALISNPQHPAHGQHGLFATRHIAPGTMVLQYLGYVHAEQDSDPGSDYDLSLDREAAVGVDATLYGNEARFINDYRGISSTGPNAEFRDCWVRCTGGVGGVRVEKRIGIYVLPAGKSAKRAKGIGKGEEILVSYGKGFWASRV